MPSFGSDGKGDNAEVIDSEECEIIEEGETVRRIGTVEAQEKNRRGSAVEAFTNLENFEKQRLQQQQEQRNVVGNGTGLDIKEAGVYTDSLNGRRSVSETHLVTYDYVYDEVSPTFVLYLYDFSRLSYTCSSR